MRKLYTILSVALVTGFMGCIGTVSVADLPENKHKFDMGPAQYSHYFHKTKVNFVDLDDQYIYFDLVDKVEMRNNTNYKIVGHAVCIYLKNKKYLGGSLEQTKVYLNSHTSKLIKFTRYFKDTSVHGYSSWCTVLWL